jgi:serine/threonine-protein kinase
VTTARNVWALASCSELLAGKKPFSFRRLADGSERIVQSVDPPTAPSRPRELSRALRRDLDRIVMKALRKEPERRYRSAEEFGEDVDRYLAGLPVQAVPDTHGYRLRKFAARRRVPLALAALAAGVVIAFAVTSLRQAREVARERDAAVAARTDSDRAVAMLVDLFGVANPRTMPGGDSLRVDDLLRIVEEKLEASTDAPRVRAKLWRTLAEVHFQRSRFDRQRVAIDRALAAAEEAGLTDEILALQPERARLVWATEGRAAAEPLLRESLLRHECASTAAPRRGRRGPGPAVVEDENGSGRSRAVARDQRDFAKRTAGDSLGLAASLNALGSFHYSQGKPLSRSSASGVAGDRGCVRSNVAACLSAMGSYAGPR